MNKGNATRGPEVKKFMRMIIPPVQPVLLEA